MERKAVEIKVGQYYAHEYTDSDGSTEVNIIKIKELPYRCEGDYAVIDDKIYSWIRDETFFK